MVAPEVVSGMVPDFSNEKQNKTWLELGWVWSAESELCWYQSVEKGHKSPDFFTQPSFLQIEFALSIVTKQLKMKTWQMQPLSVLPHKVWDEWMFICFCVWVWNFSNALLPCFSLTLRLFDVSWCKRVIIESCSASCSASTIFKWIRLFSSSFVLFFSFEYICLTIVRLLCVWVHRITCGW